MNVWWQAVGLRMQRFWREPLFWVLAGCVALGLVIAGLLYAFRPHLPIPDAMLKKLNFSVFYPGKDNAFSIDSKSVNYDESSRVLLFHVRNDSNDITITQQATPDPINDIPEYYPKLLEKLGDYKDFDSANGKVGLTHPHELNGAQSAIFNGKGTLMFAHPEHDMSNDAWQRFFNALALWTPK